MMETWFRQQWRLAQEANAETAWHVFPENIFDLVDEAGKNLASADIDFLGRTALDENVSTIEATVAIRLLAILAEEDYVLVVTVLPIWEAVLVHSSARRRYYAAEAMWQARAVDGIGALRARLVYEPAEHVRGMIEKAISMLETYRSRSKQ